MTTPDNSIRVIWKYELAIGEDNKIQMPAFAKILTVQPQGLGIYLWALVCPHVPLDERVIAVYGTGQPLPHNCGEYIGTVQMPLVALVWHVFDVTEVRQ